MSGSGGASSPSYPDYIEDLHQVMLQGGGTGDDSGASDITLSSIQNVAYSLKNALSQTPPGSKLEHYLYDPTIVDGFLDQLKTFYPKTDPNTTLTTAQIVEFVTASKGVDSLRDDFDSDTFNTMVAQILSDAYYSTQADVDSSVEESMTTMETLFESFTQKVGTDTRNAITDAIATINDLVTTTPIETDVTEITNLVEGLTTTVVESINSRISTAITKSLNVVSEFSSEINTLVVAYRNQTESKHQRAIGRLTASMGQSGSNMSSALAFGLANLEEERIRDIQSYQAGIEQEMRDKVFTLFNNAGSELNSAYSVYSSQIGNKTTKLTNFVQAYLASYVGNLQQVLGGVNQLHNTTMGIATDRGKTSSTLVGHGYLQDQATRERDRFNTLNAFLTNKQQSFENQMNYKSVIAEISKMSYLANKEYYDKKAELKTQALRWDLDSFSYVGNFLGAPGSSVSSSNQMTPTQSAMGGVATGASIGAGLGVPGAVAGSLIGGVAGYLSSQG